jgi:hypothetical protein
MSHLSAGTSQGEALCRSFLLRLWREDPCSERRVLLQDVLQGKRYCFASLEELFAFLNTPEGGANTGGAEEESL